MGMNISKKIYIIAFSCIVILVSSCSLQNSKFVIEKYQNQVPIKTYLPTYIPHGVVLSEAGTTGPISGGPDNGSMAFELNYTGALGNIRITETNSPVSIASIDNKSGINILINGIYILKIETEELDTKQPATLIKTTFYEWNYDETNFEVSDTGYNNEDGTKIVETIVAQQN